METVLAGLNRSVCLDYLYNIIVTGTTFAEHLANLRAVLLRLREAGLRLKPKKCFFAMIEGGGVFGVSRIRTWYQCSS